MNLLRTTTLCVALTVLLGAAGAARAPRKATLSCDAYSLRSYMSDGRLDYLTLPKTLADMGFKGVALNDIWMKSWDHAYLDQIKKACADAKIKIVAVICEGNLANLDEDAWQKQIDTDKQKMEAAAYLGAPVVRLNVGGLGSDEKDSTTGVDRCIKAFNVLIPTAKKLKVKMTIENHGGVSKKADWILKIINGTDPKWVGSCLDLGNWPPEERNAECAKLAKYAYHTHCKTNVFDDKGEDVNKDYKYLMGLLKNAGYKYAVSIEYEGNEDQMMGVRKTRDLILRYWPELGK